MSAAGAKKEPAPMFELDLRKSFTPEISGGKGDYHPLVKPPKGELDPKRGVHLPLEDGGLSFESRNKIDDARGSLEITFEFEETGRCTLVQAFGQYEPWLEIVGDGIQLRVYQHTLRLLNKWKTGVAYTVRVCWDNTAGVTMELSRSGGPKQKIERRCRWKAFSQKFAIFAFGGRMVGKTLGMPDNPYSSSLKGWIRMVRTWSEPLDCPAPAVRVSDLPGAKGPFPAHRDVKILEINDPPITDSPYRTNSIPDRFDDLQKTRDVAGLDEVIAPCRNELEIFQTLTRHIGMMWPHYWYWPWPEGDQRHIFWKRGHEMLPMIEDGEMGGMCGGYAHVMEEVFWSLGFDAHRIQVLGHSSFEAYSNQYDKWMLCDASFHRNCHYFIDGNGQPLGVRDMILRHLLRADDPDAFKDVRAAIVSEEGAPRIVETTWFENYCYAGIGLGDPNKKQGHRPHVWWFPEHDRPYMETADPSRGKDGSKLTGRLDDIFWSCQRTQAEMAWDKPGEKLKVSLKPFQVTFLDGFERSVDEGAWENCGKSFAWALHAGVNTLSVRSRNKMGAKGHPFRLKLWRKP